MRRIELGAVLIGASLAALGCAGRPSVVAAKGAPLGASHCDAPRDQRAILTMAGSYDVEFDFDETEVLTPGYEKRHGHKSYATELVLVVENEPGRVALQHILQLGDGPHATIIKHWRQDWAFEDRDVLEYRGSDVWERRELTAEEASCSWTQAVYGVDDAPRYDGVGRWAHDQTGSVWTSNETWRPLPRREYTTRNDYEVLVAVNRHRITKDGWYHEQDNKKLVLEPRHYLVRERGTNHYTRGKSADTRVAAAYWRDTGSFWQAVRAEWARVFATTPRLNLQSEPDGARLHDALFARADAHLPVDASTTAFIRDTLQKYVVQASASQPSAQVEQP